MLFYIKWILDLFVFTVLLFYAICHSDCTTGIMVWMVLFTKRAILGLASYTLS